MRRRAERRYSRGLQVEVVRRGQKWVHAQEVWFRTWQLSAQIVRKDRDNAEGWGAGPRFSKMISKTEIPLPAACLKWAVVSQARELCCSTTYRHCLCSSTRLNLWFASVALSAVLNADCFRRLCQGRRIVSTLYSTASSSSKRGGVL